MNEIKDSDLKLIAASVLEIAEEAGREILKIFKAGNVSSTQKENDSPLTQADLLSNKIILEGLNKLSPKLPIVSEESLNIPYETRKNWGQYWLVDPLDGTKEFINKLPDFTVNIALISDRIPILGVVVAPALGDSYWATKVDGSYKNNQRIFSEHKDKDRVAVESRFHKAPLPPELIEKYKIIKTEIIGSSLKFCLIAEGKADIYVRNNPIMEWDVAAGDAVYRYSGVDSPRSSPLQYNYEDMKILGLIIGDKK